MVLFTEALVQFRAFLEPGASVILMVGAEERPEGISLRAQSVQSLEDEAVRMQKSLRVFMRDANPLKVFRNQLQQGGDSEISVVLIRADGEREIEIALPGRYRVSPQMASAIKAAPGVLEVEIA